MIFDQLCGVAERHFPDMVESLEQAHLFHFAGAPHEFLPKEPPHFDDELFHLPFPVTAIEDDASLIVLIDLKPDQLGLKSAERFFIEALPSSNLNMTAFREGANLSPEELAEFEQQKWNKSEQDRLTVVLGKFNSVWWRNDGKITADGEVFYICDVSKKKGILSEMNPSELPQPERDMIITNGAQNSLAAIEELIMMSGKDQFILEESQAKPRKVKPGALARSHQRPVYTILTPSQIRKKIQVKQGESGTGATKRPHERRRHLRKLEAGGGSRWKETKTIVVKASWIGTSEAVVGNKKYKVRLDI